MVIFSQNTVHKGLKPAWELGNKRLQTDKEKLLYLLENFAMAMMKMKTLIDLFS